MEPEYVWRCRECGRPIHGAGVGVEPVMFCSTACESEYRRKIELSRKRKQEVDRGA